MSRIRSLHPSQWTDEDFVACSPAARLLLLGLRNEADDHGVFEWLPLSLKMRILPVDRVVIGPLLDELVEHRQIARFEVDEITYGLCLDWRHQTTAHPSYRHPAPPADSGQMLPPNGCGAPDLRQKVFARDNHTCRYCGSRSRTLEADHIVPKSRGGPTTLENLVTACRPCNRKKRDRLPSEWRA